VIEKMVAELKRNGVELRKKVRVERILIEERGGRKVLAASSPATAAFIARRRCCRTRTSRTRSSAWPARRTSARLRRGGARAVRINSSSCQVYLGIRQGESIPHIGDLVFTSENPTFNSAEPHLVPHHQPDLLRLTIPNTRPGSNRYTVVCH